MYLLGDRIIIRDFTLGDTNDVYEYSKKANIGPNAGWLPHDSKKTTKDVLVGFIYNKETFAIELKLKKKVIGNISLYQNTFRKNVKACEIGFVLNEKYWGKGYMTETVKLILDYAFTELKVEIVSIGHHLGNDRCKKTIEFCGFTFEGIFRKYKKLYNNLIIDACMYSMTIEEYQNLKGR